MAFVKEARQNPISVENASYVDLFKSLFKAFEISFSYFKIADFSFDNWLYLNA